MRLPLSLAAAAVAALVLGETNYFEYFSSFSGIAGYFAVVLALLACGLGLPVPEDIILISGGYIAFEAGHPVWPMVFWSLVGIIIGDSASYAVGRQLGVTITENRFTRRFISPARLLQVEGLFATQGPKILFVARFTPGLRAVTFFTAGVMKVPYWKFFAYDGGAALISAPLWVILGYHYGQVVVGWAKQFQWAIIAVMAIAVVSFIAYRLLRKKPAEDASTAPPPITPPTAAPEADKAGGV